MGTPAVFMAIGFTFYLTVIADAPSSQALTHLVGAFAYVSTLYVSGRGTSHHLVGNDGDGKKSGYINAANMAAINALGGRVIWAWYFACFAC
ncbi:hypothetical protein DJICPGNB_11765 [Escherichia coli]|nr:hypothetical protein DJICPGNB_11765 [Escherichia coli]